MTHTLKDRIAAYATGRKGVLLVTPLALGLILVVAALLVVTFIVSGTTTAGKLSRAALRRHLQGLPARMADAATFDAEAERAQMEVLINKVKATCEQPVISGDPELKALFGQALTAMEAMDQGPVRQRGAWLQLKSVTHSFNDLYYPAPVTEALAPSLHLESTPV